MLEEAERAAVEAAAAASSGPSTDQTLRATTPATDASVKEAFLQSASDVSQRELLFFCSVVLICL